MASNTNIEWCASEDGTPGATWNPITGCSVTSPGCTNCYAQRLAGTRLKHHPSRAGLTQMSKAGPVWTGETRLNKQWLNQPIWWTKPRKIFVCAHGDLFHESVPDAWIDRVFAVMTLAPRHIFQVLTKRADRMREYITEQWQPTPPLPNVWLGVSVEDQRRADERIPHLLETPAAVRFLSCEPLLGEVTLREIYHGQIMTDALEGISKWPVIETPNRMIAINPSYRNHTRIDWCIIGGESGPRARDMDPAWARSIRDQCAAAGVPCFVKQMARKAPIPEDLMVRQWPRAARIT